MADKVTFDPVDRLIRVTIAPDTNNEIFFDIKRDLYSAGKEDWQSTESLRRVEFPISAVAGNDLPGDKKLGTTFFIRDDWKVELYPANHRFIVNGNFYSEDGSDPFVDPAGTWAIRVMQQVSSLVDSTIQQLPEIEYASFNGGITYDEANGYAGTDKTADGRLIGSPRAPVNNVTDAAAIATERGFTTGYIIGDATFDDTVNISKFTFFGQSKDITHITVAGAANVNECIFNNAHVTGTLDGESKLVECKITDLDYVKGILEQCLLEPGTIKIISGGTAYLLDCWTGYMVTASEMPIIDMNGSGQSLVIRNHNGRLKVINKTGPEAITASLDGATLFIDLTTVTDGVIMANGVGKIVDAATNEDLLSGTYGNLVVHNNTVSNSLISNTVWEHTSASQLLSDMAFVKDIEGGKWKILNNQMIFYKDDNTTEIARFNLFNQAGTATETDVRERVRV